MKRPGGKLAIWALVGALAISLYLNFRALDRGPAPHPAQEAANSETTSPALPAFQPASFEELQLTPEQTQAIFGCCGQCQNDRLEMEEDANRLADELQLAWETSEPDEAETLRLADQLGDLWARILKSRTHSILLVRQTLTPDQFRLLAALPAEQNENTDSLPGNPGIDLSTPERVTDDKK